MSASNFLTKKKKKILMHTTSDETLDCTTLMNKLFGTLASNKPIDLCRTVIDNIPLEIVFHIISYLDTTRKYYLANVLGCLDYFFKKDLYVVKLSNLNKISMICLNHSGVLVQLFIIQKVQTLCKLYKFINRQLRLQFDYKEVDHSSLCNLRYFNECIILIKHYSENKIKDVILAKGFTNDCSFNFFDKIYISNGIPEEKIHCRYNKKMCSINSMKTMSNNYFKLFNTRKAKIIHRPIVLNSEKQLRISNYRCDFYDNVWELSWIKTKGTLYLVIYKWLFPVEIIIQYYNKNNFNFMTINGITTVHGFFFDTGKRSNNLKTENLHNIFKLAKSDTLSNKLPLTLSENEKNKLANLKNSIQITVDTFKYLFVHNGNIDMPMINEIMIIFESNIITHLSTMYTLCSMRDFFCSVTKNKIYHSEYNKIITDCTIFNVEKLAERLKYNEVKKYYKTTYKIIQKHNNNAMKINYKKYFRIQKKNNSRFKKNNR